MGDIERLLAIVQGEDDTAIASVQVLHARAATSRMAPTWATVTTTLGHLRALVAATPAPEPVAVLLESRWHCPACGVGVRADEDGCCRHCGEDCSEVRCEVTIRALLVAEGAQGTTGAAAAYAYRCTQCGNVPPVISVSGNIMSQCHCGGVLTWQSLPVAEEAPPPTEPRVGVRALTEQAGLNQDIRAKGSKP